MTYHSKKKLLICTQVVDTQDDVLGFFHEWIKHFASECESVEVICLFEGAHDLPPNVRVHSLGKEKGAGKLRRALRLYRYLWKLRGCYQGVFVHMNPEYLVLAGWWWKFAHIRTLLWYSHRQVDLKLRIAEKFVDTIASSAKTSFMLKTSKLHVTGHGVDIELFALKSSARQGRWRLVSVGRITSIKRLKTAVEALAILRKSGVDAELVLVGKTVTSSDKVYERELQEQIQTLSLDPYIVFAGSVPYGKIAAVYQSADISLNLAPTGGLDKAVLESMACGLPTLLSNEGFAEFLGPYQKRLLFEQDNPRDLAEKLRVLYHARDLIAISAFFRLQVAQHASLERLIASLLSLLWPNK